jgi:hypothetical protein
MDMTLEIERLVRLVDQLREQKQELWRKAHALIVREDVENAIPLLNRYFAISEQLEGTESTLASILKSQFSDR